MEESTKIVLAIALPTAIVIGFVAGFLLSRIQILSPIERTQFEILSDNGVLGVESVYPEIKYNYTVYVEIKHVLGDTNTITIYCELTREDLTKITKHQTISLQKGQTKIIEFLFSNEDLRGAVPHQYKIYGEGKP